MGERVGEKGYCLKKWSDRVLNVLYPKCCPMCHRILKKSSLLICRECAEKIIPVSGSRCFLCGKPVREDQEYCAGCSGRQRSFDQGKGIFFYDERMKASILRYKYDGRRQYGDFYAKAMYIYAQKEIVTWKPDVIVPVPLYPRKKRMRGFNQAEDLAVKLSRYTNIPADTEMLKKVKDTKSQKKINEKERRKNLKGAFKASCRVKGKKILVVDDVYTTGSTMDEAAASLKEAGAEKVYFLTVCTGMDIMK